MKLDELVFFNRQLATMLRNGTPLEGALLRLCEEMEAGTLKTELQALEADLAKGVTIADALKARDLPEIYKHMVLVGIKSGDLPGALIMLADYFNRQNNLWMRLKGLMVYPLVVLGMAFFVSLIFTYISMNLLHPSIFEIFGTPPPARAAYPLIENFWIVPTTIAMLILAVLTVMAVPGLREKIRWMLPAFKDASLARVADFLGMLLKGGVNLYDAVTLAGEFEPNPKTAADLVRWRRAIAAGTTHFSEIAAGGRVFPKLFVWVVANADEDLPAGFQQASEIYHSRAIYRTDVAMHAVLPAATFCLGTLILLEGGMLIVTFLSFMMNDSMI